MIAGKEYERGERRDDFQITCAFNPSHKMPEKRLLWHYANCKDKRLKEHLFTICEYNCLHYVLIPELQKHYQNCEDKRKAVKQQKQSGTTQQEEQELRRQIQEAIDQQNREKKLEEQKGVQKKRRVRRRDYERDSSLIPGESILLDSEDLEAQAEPFKGDWLDLWHNLEKYYTFYQAYLDDN